MIAASPTSYPDSLHSTYCDEICHCTGGFGRRDVQPIARLIFLVVFG